MSMDNVVIKKSNHDIIKKNATINKNRMSAKITSCASIKKHYWDVVNVVRDNFNEAKKVTKKVLSENREKADEILARFDKKNVVGIVTTNFDKMRQHIDDHAIKLKSVMYDNMGKKINPLRKAEKEAEIVVEDIPEEVVEEKPEKGVIDVTADVGIVADSVEQAFGGVPDYDEVEKTLSGEELNNFIDEVSGKIIDETDNKFAKYENKVTIDEQPIVTPEEISKDNNLITPEEVEKAVNGQNDGEVDVKGGVEDTNMSKDKAGELIGDQLNNMVVDKNEFVQAGDLDDVKDKVENIFMSKDKAGELIGDQLDDMVDGKDEFVQAGDLDGDKHELVQAGDLDEVKNNVENIFMSKDKAGELIGDQLDDMVDGKDEFVQAGDLDGDKHELVQAGDLDEVKNNVENIFMSKDKAGELIGDQLDDMVDGKDEFVQAGDLDDVKNNVENIFMSKDKAGELIGDQLDDMVDGKDEFVQAGDLDDVKDKVEDSVDENSNNDETELEEYEFVQDDNKLELSDSSEKENTDNEEDKDIENEENNKQESDEPLFKLSFNETHPAKVNIGIDGYVIHEDDKPLEYNYTAMTDEEIKASQAKLAEVPLRDDVIAVYPRPEIAKEEVIEQEEQNENKFINQENEAEQDEEIARLRELINAARQENKEANELNRNIIEKEKNTKLKFEKTAKKESEIAEEAENVQNQKNDSESRLNAARERFEKFLEALRKDTAEKNADTEKHQKNVESTQDSINLLEESIVNLNKNIDDDKAKIDELNGKVNKFNELIGSGEEVEAHIKGR